MRFFFSKNSLRGGKKLLDAGGVKDLQFSEGIYQFTIKTPKAEGTLYPVLQVDDHGKLIDALCECPLGSKDLVCEHLAAGWLKIFGNETLPMHVRFRQSFWNVLLKEVAANHGFSFDKAQKQEKGTWKLKGCSLRALSRRGQMKIAHILKPSKKALENSLKFSSLSPEEHLLWREGRASSEIFYRLSAWSDLAEWLFSNQEKQEEYTIKFAENATLPDTVHIRFPDVELSINIDEQTWIKLIPSLSTVTASLRLFFSQYAPIDRATYDEQKKTLDFAFATTPLISEEGCRREILFIENWLFIPELGFFPAHRDPILGEKSLTGTQIAEFFDRHLPIAQGCMKTSIDPTVRPLKYVLNFVEKTGLEIEGYLFEPDDLRRTGCAQFDHWIYLPKQGFFKCSFPCGALRKTISIDEISSFIANNRLFLLEHEGFQIHLSTIEAALSYRVDQADNLHFELAIEEGAEQEGVYDLGEWVYIRGRGFYPKTKQSGVLRAGLVVTPSDLSAFIEKHTHELEAIPRFFSSKCPIQASGLSIFLNDEKRIVVEPSFQRFQEYLAKEVKILGSYTYVEGEGFTRIPDPLQLPEHFTRGRMIPIAREADFVMHQLEQLRPFLLNLDTRLTKPNELILKLQQFRRSSSAATSWDLQLFYESTYGKISLREIKQGMLQKKSYLFSSAGLIMLDLPRFAWIKEITLTALKKTSQCVRLKTIECLKLAAFEQTVNADGQTLTTEDWQALFEARIERPLSSLEGLKSVLRPYQVKGFEWLWMLYLQGLSGLLCDEMGLGKSHQAMALIAAIRNRGRNNLPFLIVCPTSVIFHWQELFQKFLPSARIHVFHGAQRDAFCLKSCAEVIVTSYGILRSERKLFKQLSFSLVILDEIQVAKNPKSLTNRSLKTVKAEMFLGLTGTPIENRLLDLQALFDVVLPNYLPKDFEKLYAVENGWENDPKRKLLLRHLVSPFILRRKKSEVLTELPEKTEEVYYCTLSPEQEKLYREAMNVEAKPLLSDLQDNDKLVSYVHIFAFLVKLKKVCDHPCLVLPDSEDYFGHASGKWELFVELLNEARESGQKVVVFSQFLKMLDIIDAYLDERGIGHAGIRGSTRDRQSEVRRFLDDPNCEVFVASLQAAGVGIDLVAASIVIHYDRWWNPAKENQATDRVHRIGQKRGVQVFKLVNKNSIEEHIDHLIKKKSRLLQEALSDDEQDMLKRFDRSELIELLQKLME